MIDTGLRDKVVLLTGANHGIGAATATAFAAQGARVFITYLRFSPEEHGISQAEADQAHTPGAVLYRAQQARSADDVLSAIRATGGEGEAWEADLAEPATIPQLFDRVEVVFGPVDVLVNNAAHCVPDTFLPGAEAGSEEQPKTVFPRLSVTPEAIDQHFAVNTRATALLMAEFGRRHIARDRRWGRVINVSTDGASAFAGTISYGASKHALESYSRAAASEFGRYGITVNVVSLGPVQTGYIPPELESRLVSEIPLGRIGEPNDAADPILFFASEQARWVTGQLLYVGGGHVMPL
jgi:3-oxoacyl-[acyl-carrier protein] reductase